MMKLPSPMSLRPWVLLVVVSLLAACAGTAEKPKPAELAPNPALIGVRPVWASRISSVAFPLEVNVSGSTVALAGSDGAVALLDTRSGADLWRANVGAGISAGVGSDGRFVSVVTVDNELVTLEGGREIWRQKLTAQGYTAPLVAGAAVKAKVLSQGRGDKVRIYKMRRRKHYRKSQGHRQNFTELEITGIAG